jgi:hypothetical protein
LAEGGGEARISKASPEGARALWSGKGVWRGRLVSPIGEPGDLKPFIDVEGASGSVYRFRWIDDPLRLPAMSGNFLFLRSTGEGAEVVCCGTASSLFRAGAIWPPAVESHQTQALFVRLNVSRTVRASEHDDIVEGQKPTLVVTDLE